MIFPKSEKLSGTPKPTVVSVIMLYQTASRNLISSEYISANAPNKTKMRMETTKINILLYNAENLFIVNEFLYKFTKITVMIDDLRKIYYNVFQHQKYVLTIAKWKRK